MDAFFNKFGMTQKEFEQKEKLVYDILHGKITDLMDSLQSLNATPRLIKSRLVFVMIMVDVFSRLMMVFEDRESTASKTMIQGLLATLKRFFTGDRLSYKNRERFEKWLNRFVYTEENEVWRNERKNFNYNTQTIWKLRNAIVHFYGLPSSKSIVLVNGKLPDDQIVQLNKKCVTVINTVALEKAVHNGQLVQLDQMKEVLKTNPIFYVNGILRLHAVIFREGTFYTQLKNYATT